MICLRPNGQVIDLFPLPYSDQPQDSVGVRLTWIQIPVQPLTGWAMLGKQQSFPVPQYIHVGGDALQ